MTTTATVPSDSVSAKSNIGTSIVSRAGVSVGSVHGNPSHDAGPSEVASISRSTATLPAIAKIGSRSKTKNAAADRRGRREGCGMNSSDPSGAMPEGGRKPPPATLPWPRRPGRQGSRPEGSAPGVAQHQPEQACVAATSTSPIGQVRWQPARMVQSGRRHRAFSSNDVRPSQTIPGTETGRSHRPARVDTGAPPSHRRRNGASPGTSVKGREDYPGG